ncbi:Aspartokinase [Candidatus Rhabdochlamydia oedothoracis]|uniref:Aspartokinase n=1 Tax=Candidatus Rhabdochlamydia oedothoracis TaxID=2720720 RepID=A0ABX8V763_9BACT|nr:MULTISPECIES: aspartate kinase [Rhabdochlamydia]KAG6559464.1 Aspartokinase [Candidatus Rhabdochlamydia sp. W815]MCL6756156.1 aspartate kinase [Candidatus Rhabdochlamydia oedothoracis]QYF49059.1 Aspartokinase [Candidatus Rhabdochlamydia oedothoracis]
MKKIVLKFGGAALADLGSFYRISKMIKAKLSSHSVCVVVSAMQGVTDQLLQVAKKIDSRPPLRELDMLVSTGEVFSMTLLAMALHKEGIEAISLTGEQAGIITSSCHVNAKIIYVNKERLSKELESGKVVIVAGFQGISKNKEITTLGRGGSDITAVALAIALSCKMVQFYKDVEGIYSMDPKTYPEAELLKNISYEKALELAENQSKILHPRCIILAAAHQISLQVSSFLHPNSTGTTISNLNCAKKPNFLYEWEHLRI